MSTTRFLLIIKTLPQLIKIAGKKVDIKTHRHEFYMLDLHGICIFNRR